MGELVGGQVERKRDCKGSTVDPAEAGQTLAALSNLLWAEP